MTSRSLRIQPPPFILSSRPIHPRHLPARIPRRTSRYVPVIIKQHVEKEENVASNSKWTQLLRHTKERWVAGPHHALATQRERDEEERLAMQLADQNNPFESASVIPRGQDASEGIRMACRTCDTTITRGGRGIHIQRGVEVFQTTSLAVNEELIDTLSIDSVDDAFPPSNPHISILVRNNMHRHGTVRCPCCHSNLGTLVNAHSRTAVILKPGRVVWTHALNEIPTPRVENLESYVRALPPSKQSVPLSPRLFVKYFGLRTHHQRLIADVHSLSQVVDAVATSDMSPLASQTPPPSPPPESTTANPIEEILYQIRKHVYLRTTGNNNTESGSNTGVEGNDLAVTAPSPPPPRLVVHDSEIVFAKAVESLCQGNPTHMDHSQLLTYWLRLLHAASSKGKFIRILALATCPFDDAPPQAMVRDCAMLLRKLNREGGASFVRAPWYSSLSNRLLTMSTYRVIAYLQPIEDELTDVRSIKMEVLNSVVKAIAERVTKYGPGAGAFGMSERYLLDACALLELTPQMTDTLLENATFPHPSPSARFDQPLDAEGMAILNCAVPSCEAHATHVLKGKVDSLVPLFCKDHAPSHDYVDVFAQHHVSAATTPTGTSTPDGSVTKRVDGGTTSNTAVVAERPVAHAPRPHRFNKPNRIVEAPDARPDSKWQLRPNALQLGTANVHVVYTLEQLKEAELMVKDHVQKANELMVANSPSLETAIGIDVEWKPQFRFDPNAIPASIMQMAMRDRVFIFDVMTLGKHLGPVVSQLFPNPTVAKIGHGIGEDLYRVVYGISRAMGDFEFPKTIFPIPSIVELAPLFTVAHQFYGMPSLARMVTSATGLELDKSCQMTDWQLRPLTPAQIQYAATDAHCAFQLLDTFIDKIKLNGQEFDISKYIKVEAGTNVPRDLDPATFNTPPPRRPWDASSPGAAGGFAKFGGGASSTSTVTTAKGLQPPSTDSPQANSKIVRKPFVSQSSAMMIAAREAMKAQLRRHGVPIGAQHRGSVLGMQVAEAQLKLTLSQVVKKTFASDEPFK